MPPVRPRQSLPRRVLRRLGWAVRDRFPHREVRRHVQGVDLVLPWSHRLPDYAAFSPEYGQNLPALAAALAAEDGAPVSVLDVGANVGDSALQVLHAAPGRVLCVEGDAYYLDLLRRNTAHDPRIVVEPSLLAVGAQDGGLAPVRVGGTTRFARTDAGSGPDRLGVDALRARHPDFDALRLLKSDTDGYDVEIVPAVAAAWAHSRPVLFFEYDPHATRQAGLEPLAVWDALAGLGYDLVGVWENSGQPVGLLPLDELPTRSRVLDQHVGRRARTFWDVAVVHGQDDAGRAALTAVLGEARGYPG